MINEIQSGASELPVGINRGAESWEGEKNIPRRSRLPIITFSLSKGEIM